MPSPPSERAGLPERCGASTKCLDEPDLVGLLVAGLESAAMEALWLSFRKFLSSWSSHRTCMYQVGCLPASPGVGAAPAGCRVACSGFPLPRALPCPSSGRGHEDSRGCLCEDLWARRGCRQRYLHGTREQFWNCRAPPAAGRPVSSPCLHPRDFCGVSLLMPSWATSGGWGRRKRGNSA